jgi:hypothetical protein
MNLLTPRPTASQNQIRNNQNQSHHNRPFPSLTHHSLPFKPHPQKPVQPFSQVLKFCFERFPSWLDYQTLRRVFLKYGDVTDLFHLKEEESEKLEIRFRINEILVLPN